MKTALRIEGPTAYFVIEELKPQYHEAARGLFYTSFEGAFAKRFPSDTPKLDHIYANFQRYAEEMILQTAGIHSVPWEKALTTFMKAVENKNIDWWLGGSAALAVRGIEVLPRDIDLIVAESDCARLGELLDDYLIEPVVSGAGWIANRFGRAFVDARVEWIGGVNEHPDTPYPSDYGLTASRMLEMVNWNGVEIRVPPLDLQMRACERRGFTDRVEKIRRYQLPRA